MLSPIFSEYDTMRIACLLSASLVAAILCGCATELVPERVKLESMARYGELVEFLEEKQAESGDDSAFALYPLCYAYSKVKDYARLFECVDRLEARIRSGDTEVTLYTGLTKSDGSPTPHLLRAEAYIELQRYDSAIDQAQTALDLTAQVTNRFLGVEKTQHTIHALGLLALATALSGDRARALQLVAALEELDLPHTGSAQTRPMRNRALANVFMALRDYGRALEILNSRDGRAVRAFTSALLGGGDNIFATIDLPLDYMRARCLLETGKPAEAQRVLDRLLENPRTRYVGDIHWLVLFDRGRVAETDGLIAEAIGFYGDAVVVIERARASISTETNKIGFVGDKEEVYQRLVALLVEQGDVAAAFDYVERAKSRALVDLLASKREFAVPGMESDAVREMLARLDTADQELRVSGDEPDRSTRAMRDVAIVQRETEEAAPQLFSLVTVNSVPPAELRQLVAPDEALVEYYQTQRHLYAFVMDRASIRAVELNVSHLAEIVAELRQAISDPTSDEWQETARAAYDELWRPVEALVPTQAVTLVPHGALHYIPFAALLDDDRHQLIDRHSLRLLPSASVLRFLRPDKGVDTRPILAMGNPDLEDPSMDLRYAELEARRIAALFPGSRTLTRKDASETNFKRAASLFSALHFATHGKFQPSDPLDSGLYLAADDANDGILTVTELYSMNLDADLVTLSACETGLGEIGNGDDIIGLTRGFLYAGSRSIIASLWNVDDMATASLMERFYSYLGRFPRREALRQAQLSVRDEFAHPFYWSAFQLTGRGD